MEAIIIGGNALRVATTALPSVMSTTTAAPTGTVSTKAPPLAGTLPNALVASPPAYVSDIHANPIYRRKAVTRICG